MFLMQNPGRADFERKQGKRAKATKILKYRVPPGSLYLEILRGSEKIRPRGAKSCAKRKKQFF